MLNEDPPLLRFNLMHTVLDEILYVLIMRKQLKIKISFSFSQKLSERRSMQFGTDFYK